MISNEVLSNLLEFVAMAKQMGYDDIILEHMDLAQAEWDENVATLRAEVKCEACSNFGWLHAVNDDTGRNEVQRCDACELITDDESAGVVHSTACGCDWTKRSSGVKGILFKDIPPKRDELCPVCDQKFHDHDCR